MVPLALADEISIGPAAAFAFSCSEPSLANDDNLAVRAVRSLAADGEPVRRRLDLLKRIPSQAGLGGGSSDAASVLIAAMDGAFGEQPQRDWVALARGLGSDVPFFLAGTGALVEGTGERVTAVGSLPEWHVAIVKPPVALLTIAAYKELDRHERSSRARRESVSLRVLEALQRGDFDTVNASLQNDFHEPMAAAYPQIATALDALKRAGAQRALLSGSGSAVFTLGRDAATIDTILRKLDLGIGYECFAARFASTPAWNMETAARQ